MSTDEKYAPLRIGRDIFSKNFLVENMKIGNFHACRRVTRACKDMEIRSIEEFLNTAPEAFAAMPDFGELSCLVVLRVREWKKRDLGWKSAVTFRSIKNREMKDIRQEVKAKHTRRKSHRAKLLAKQAGDLFNAS